MWSDHFLFCFGITCFERDQCGRIYWWKWSCSVMSDSLQPPWTVAHQALPSMEFSRQKYWSGLPFPSPRKCSSFILLQEVDQFSQHQLLKRFVFSPLHSLASFVKDNVSIGVWIYLWAFYFIPLIYMRKYNFMIEDNCTLLNKSLLILTYSHTEASSR